jgi:thiamine pyrophosphokinase
MRAVIVAGGTIKDSEYIRAQINENDKIVCADSGCNNAKKLGIVPDVVIGDFDSFPKEEAVYKEELISLPTEKDRTDTHECVCYCIEKGADEIVLLAATGTRLDHTIANLHLLKVASGAGVKMKIVNENNEIFLIDKECSIPKKEGFHLSLLPVGRAAGISATGVYYPLSDGVMEFGNPYGVSNEFTEDVAKISVKDGLLLAFLSRD